MTSGYKPSTKQNRNKQTNKQANKQTKKHSQQWALEPDQFCWGARAKITLMKSRK